MGWVAQYVQYIGLVVSFFPVDKMVGGVFTDAQVIIDGGAQRVLFAIPLAFLQDLSVEGRCESGLLDMGPGWNDGSKRVYQQ